MNLLQIIGSDTRLKRTSGTAGGEYHGACPLCNAEGKRSFWVQPKYGTTGRWRCRVCDQGGDAYRYVMQKQGLGFRAAKALVDGDPVPSAGYKPKVDLSAAPDDPAPTAEPGRERDAPSWQARVRQFIHRSANLADEKPDLWKWLAARGVSQDVAVHAEIGANPEKFGWGGYDFFRGIVIPCYDADGTIAYCKVRTGAGRYLHIRGGDGTAVYGLPNLSLKPDGCQTWSGNDVILVETELDALMLRSVLASERTDLALWQQAALGSVTPLALGSATGGRQHASTIDMNAHRVFVALDADEAGDAAARWWLGKDVARLRPVGAKDPGDMYKAGGAAAIWAWLEPVLFGS